MLFRIFKMIATSDFLTALECTKFVFGWEAYSAPPDTLAGLRRRGRERGRGRGRGMEERGGKGGRGRDGP